MYYTYKWEKNLNIVPFFSRTLSDCSLCSEACCCSAYCSLSPPCTGGFKSVFRFVPLQKTPVPRVSSPAPACDTRLWAATAAPWLPAQWSGAVEHRGRLRVHLVSARWVINLVMPAFISSCEFFFLYSAERVKCAQLYRGSSHLFIICFYGDRQTCNNLNWILIYKSLKALNSIDDN